MSLPFVSQSTLVHRRRSGDFGSYDGQHKFDITSARYNHDVQHTLSYNYGQSFGQIHIMNGDYLHNIGYHGENMTIALLDAGFRHADILPAFDSLFANNQVLGTWDFVANEASVYEDFAHGIEVLSTIGGNVPGQLVGTTPKASFWLLRTEDVSSEYLIEEYNWDAGAEFADSAGADIISTSLGYTTFNNPAQSHSYADMNGHTTPCAMAANIAFSKGMVVIASAGNDALNAWHYIGTPADGDSVMAVGAIDNTGTYAGFSSTGPSSDGDIKPNVAAVGQGTFIAYTDSSFGPGSGTSFSCPVLAGSAACLWQAFPTRTNRQIFAAIQESASQFQNPDSLLGYGIPDFMLASQILGGVDPANLVSQNPVYIYPNPSHGQTTLNVYSDTHQSISMDVLDVVGKKILHRNIEADAKKFVSAAIDLSGEESGVYFISVAMNNGIFTKKLVKL